MISYTKINDIGFGVTCSVTCRLASLTPFKSPHMLKLYTIVKQCYKSIFFFQIFGNSKNKIVTEEKLKLNHQMKSNGAKQPLELCLD